MIAGSWHGRLVQELKIHTLHHKHEAEQSPNSPSLCWWHSSFSLAVLPTCPQTAPATGDQVLIKCFSLRRIYPFKSSQVSSTRLEEYYIRWQREEVSTKNKIWGPSSCDSKDGAAIQDDSANICRLRRKASVVLEALILNWTQGWQTERVELWHESSAYILQTLCPGKHILF